MNSPSHVSEKGCHLKAAGSYLLSHSVAAAVPSAQEGLTSVFGMGTGMTLPLSPPRNLRLLSFQRHVIGIVAVHPILTSRSAG